MDYTFPPSAGGGATYPEVATWADLPAAGTVSGLIYVVQQTTGIIGFRKLAGLWRSDGATWIYLGLYGRNAAEITFVPAGTVASGDVQGAIEELDGDLQAHKSAGGSQHPDATTSVSGFMSGADKTKLNGIATGATANDTDANLKARANHTGTQVIATIAAAASARIFGRVTAAAGPGEELTAAQVKALLAITSADISDWTEAVQDVIGAMIVAAGGSYDDGAGTITLPGGGGGSPGGNTGEVQFKNGAAFAGAANVEIDNGDLTLAENTTPVAPGASILKLFAKKIAGRMMLAIVGPSGQDTTLQPHITRNKVAAWNPPGNATTVPGVFGVAAVTAVGTATARNVATTNRFTRLRRLGYVSAATAGALSGQTCGAVQWTIGNGSGEGGFHLIFRFGASDAATVAGARQFTGMVNNTTAPTNVEPSTMTNCIGVGHGAADTNLRIFFGGSAAQTSVDLGANFPANTLSVDPYELSLFASGADQNVGWRVENIRTGNVASGTIINTTPGTTLPLNTAFLGPRAWRSNNATALAVGLDIIGWSVDTDN